MKNFKSFLSATFIIGMCLTACADVERALVSPPAQTHAQAQTSVSAQAVLEHIKSAYGEHYPPSIPMTQEQLLQYGLTPDLYDECAHETAAITVYLNKVVVVKAKPEKINEVEAALETFRHDIITNTLQYPMNIEKAQATSVTRKGNYIALILAGETLQDTELSQSERLNFAVEQNGVGVEAFLEVTEN
ncbi:MAG: DUF4358 domain-containing protein [Oscillospiraceae bacterium]|nr:DUF4358 domain-containing protein [Oscillospiraceae bacterium]